MSPGSSGVATGQATVTGGAVHRPAGAHPPTGIGRLPGDVKRKIIGRHLDTVGTKTDRDVRHRPVRIGDGMPESGRRHRAQLAHRLEIPTGLRCDFTATICSTYTTSTAARRLHTSQTQLSACYST